VSLRAAPEQPQMAGQAVFASYPGRRNYLVMLSDVLEGLSRPSIHCEGLSNTFCWPLQCAGNEVRYAAFASSTLMEWLESHRHVAGCSLLEDLVLLDSG